MEPQRTGLPNNYFRVCIILYTCSIGGAGPTQHPRFLSRCSIWIFHRVSSKKKEVQVNIHVYMCMCVYTCVPLPDDSKTEKKSESHKENIADRGSPPLLLAHMEMCSISTLIVPGSLCPQANGSSTRVAATAIAACWYILDYMADSSNLHTLARSHIAAHLLKQASQSVSQ